MNRGMRHREHVKDARRWGRETHGDDWILVKVHRVEEARLRYVYFWAGPRGTRTRFVAYGTKHSNLFLQHLRSGLAGYRAAMAHEVTEIPADAQDWTI